MKLTSSVFENGEMIPIEYTCDGDDTNPPLVISNIPTEAVSLTLIVDDPDAPGGLFTHWLVWNIDPQVSEIESGTLPEGAEEGMNSSRRRGYMGPCPPSGTHRYFFRLYALDINLELSGNTQREELEDEIEDHIIASTEIHGLYGKEGSEEENTEEGLPPEEDW